MSCLIWLPLNGSLDNNGIWDASFALSGSATGLSVASNGKIYQCYERTAASTNLYRSTNKINLNQDITMMCWAYVTSAGTSANGLVTNHSHTDNTGVGITVKQISTSDYRISCNTGNGSSRTYNTYYGTTNIKNKWCHLALTYNKVKKQLLLYVNGNVEYTLNNYSNASKADYIDLFSWSTTYSSSDYKPLGKLNDIRIYDECLSRKEIKEISKGLILHYPMNEIDGEIGGRNYFDKNKINNLAWYSAGHLGTGTNYRGYSFPVTAGEQITLYRTTAPTSANNGRFGLFWCNTEPVNGVVPVSTAFNNANGPANTVYTYTVPSGITWGFLYLSNNISNTNCWIPDIMLEKGNVAHEYLPPMEAPEKIYDTSGYSNNTSLFLTPAWTDDTPKGSGSYNFNGGKYLVSSKQLHLEESTYSVWVNFNSLSSGFIIDARTSDVGYQPMYYSSSSGIQIYSSVNGGNTYIPYSFTVGQWYHLVAVMEKTGSKLYVNGALVGSSTAQTGSINGKVYLGIRHSLPSTPNGVDAKMCDLKVFSTALSANDIKKMYEIPISLADNGTLYCSSYIEGDNTHSFTETGLIKYPELTEGSYLDGVEGMSLDDGSCWARLFYHNCVGGTVLFSSEAEALETTSTNKFSRLKYLNDNFKGTDGKFEFILKYPTDTTQYNRWKQTNNPCTETETNGDGTATAVGYEAIHIDWTGNYWGGLTKSSSNSTFLDGSTGHGNWFYAIGARVKHSSGIPSYNATANDVELWVRIDNLKTNKMKLFKDNIVLNKIIEN